MCSSDQSTLCFFFLFFTFFIIFILWLSLLLHPSVLTILQHQDGVTIGLEVLLPKEAKLHSDVSSPLQYDVFLYKVANNADSSCHSQGAPSNSSISHPLPKSPKAPRSPNPHHSSSGGHPSPSRHSAPGCYSSPICHPFSSPTQLCSPRGAAPNSGRSPRWRDYQSRPIRSSPSSPHLTRPPPSPSRAKCIAVSTRSLPPLSWPNISSINLLHLQTQTHNCLS